MCSGHIIFPQIRKYVIFDPQALCLYLDNRVPKETTNLVAVVTCVRCLKDLLPVYVWVFGYKSDIVIKLTDVYVISYHLFDEMAEE